MALRISRFVLSVPFFFALAGCDETPARQLFDAGEKDSGALEDRPVAPQDVASDAPVTLDRVDTDAPPPPPPPPGMCRSATGTGSAATDRWTEGSDTAAVSVMNASSCARTYVLTSTARLRDNQPANPRTVVERAGTPTVRTRNDLFDALYALAQDEVRENSVDRIRDGAFNNGNPIDCPAGGCFETGRLWTYVWTRDTSYSVNLALGSMDPIRARNSLEFKLSARRGGGDVQVVQDTGTGGAYPVSTDRVVWALAATELLKYLDGDARVAFRDRAWEAVRNTVEHDRALVWDSTDGLYTGEHSFLDWREQSYPAWTATDTVHIGMSKSLSTNVLHYAALDAAASFAAERNDASAARYRMWADALRTAIRTRFWNADARQFSAFSTTTLDPAPVRRWDLLGTSLAVLTGVADDTQARAAVASYPHAGRGGAPVLWPQQQFTAIYHNRSMWPFVTAYWLRAARRVRNDAAVNRNVTALVRGAALNLSNMENLEFLSGASRVEDGMYSGPVVNSQRQLWSVAGYLAMVHDVIFGLEAGATGVRFRPYVTRELRNTLFANADSIVLNDFPYRGKRLDVVLSLPPRGTNREGAYAVGSVRLDGREVGEMFLGGTALPARGLVEVTLTDTPEPAARIRDVTDTSDPKSVFGPRTPSIRSVAEQGGRVQLTLDPGGENPADITFNLYRDGALIARDLPGTTTQQPDSMSTDQASVTHCYTVEAVYRASGNASQHAAPQCWWGRNYERIRSVYAYDFANTGGTGVTRHGRFHYENWGDVGHRLEVPYFRPSFTGDHLIQVVAGNGSGGFTTGITCGVKRVVVEETPSGTMVASGFVMMPQAADWASWRDSSFVRARLDATRTYRIVVRDDERAVNMSAFEHFARYTGGTGGAGGAFNRENIAEVKVLALNGFPAATGSRVALDGANDLADFAADQRATPGIPVAMTDGVGFDWDNDWIYLSVNSRSIQMAQDRPYMLYVQAETTPFAAAATRRGMTYFDQTPNVPFEANYVLAFRRQSDLNDGAGPWNGLFRWDGARWVRALRFENNRDFWVASDGSTLSVRLPRSQLGLPTRLRLAGHLVQGGGNYNVTVPADHQPWVMGRTQGFYEIDLAGAHPVRSWTAR